MMMRMFVGLYVLCFGLILNGADIKSERASQGHGEPQPPEGEIPASLTSKVEESEENLLKKVKFTSVIKDVKGDITTVADMRLYIVQGRLKTFARCLIVEKGEAEVLVGLSDIACMMRKRNSDAKWDIYLKNGSKMTGNLKVRSPLEYVVGDAVYDNMTFYYSIEIDNIEWIAQVTPKIDWVRVEDGKLIIKDPK